MNMKPVFSLKFNIDANFSDTRSHGDIFHHLHPVLILKGIDDTANCKNIAMNDYHLACSTVPNPTKYDMQA